ncbi:MAG: hypothetical protein HRU48_15585 [Vibrio sp.]|uniref:hypothetical protein n=1 Tax=Vibrio sp. TaxID=678 RepID=UPI001ED64143|nr:hypothetical protein [Vibrio sp.]NRB68769.1 hypothetical protein [Vibrio sp.]
MTEEINYCKSQSIYTEDGKYAVSATSPCHQPCADMEGMTNVDPNKTRRSALIIQKLRERHGLNKSRQGERSSNPLSYLCTETECSGPLIGEPNDKPPEVLDERWRMRLKEKALRLPNRKIQRPSEVHETA